MANPTSEPACIALIVAAGRGTRLGGPVPKQYRDLGGVPVLRRTLELFASHPRIDAIRVVTGADDAAHYNAATAGLALLPPVAGGATRQASVLNGLESLEAQKPNSVLIHDAARPFATADLIDRLIAALDRTQGAIAAVPVVDTLWRAADGNVETLVPRDGLWRAQTPQAFRYADILAAHRKAAGQALTDDAAVLRAAGGSVGVVEAAENNFKITTEADLARAQAQQFLANADLRVGTGFDVHRLGPGDGVWLCGVKLPFDQALVGHSDADVAIHALVDALLGALGDGDIGAHFPPSDMRWKGAASSQFLRHAASLVAARGGAIRHVDVTIICERPKIGPHRAALRASLAELLGVPEGRVSVKATTTEGLGFTGRGEGIAAQAAATIALPFESSFGSSGT
jgi:2-C-methyl-D-erythritol 4-phosphate cytidylyltransferase/2-C-methyl-D-erythritol 2,4-cyclodiphosphate synthase